MRMRNLALVIVGALVLSIGAVACGGDGDDGGNGGGGDGRTLEAFFSELEVSARAWDDRGTALDQQAETDFDNAESAEEEVRVFTQFIDDGRASLNDFVNELNALEAPAEAGELLGAAVTSGNELLGLFDDMLTVLATAETFEEATLLIEGPGFVAATQAFRGTCTALEDLANDSGISADLRCG